MKLIYRYLKSESNEGQLKAMIPVVIKMMWLIRACQRSTTNRATVHWWVGSGFESRYGFAHIFGQCLQIPYFVGIPTKNLTVAPTCTVRRAHDPGCTGRFGLVVSSLPCTLKISIDFIVSTYHNFLKHPSDIMLIWRAAIVSSLPYTLKSRIDF